MSTDSPLAGGWGAPSGPAREMAVDLAAIEMPLWTVRLSRVCVYANGFDLVVEGAGQLTASGKRDWDVLARELRCSVSLASGRAVVLDDSAGLKSGVGPMLTRRQSTWGSDGETGKRRLVVVSGYSTSAQTIRAIGAVGRGAR